MAVLMVPPYLQFLDNNGLILNGGFVGTYSSGTDTPKATYTDNTEGTPADNPVELDAYGRATIWINGSYRFKIYDSAMNLLRTTDGVTSFSVPAASANAYFQSFSGDGVTTVFTTSSDLGTDEKAIMVFVDAGGTKGYDLINPSAYTISGTSLTFSVAPASGTNNVYVTAPSLLLGAASSSAAAAATSETNAAASALLASQWATLTSGIVAATDYSAKAWAIGGTGVTSTSGKGAAKEWATKTSAAVDTAEYSAKAYAIGGTGVTTTSGKGAAKEWATTTGGAVDTSEFSAKEYATGTTVTTGSAKSWATLTSGLVATVDGSAKAWAIGGTGISTTAAKGAAKEWAITTGAAVDTSEYSAKEYATGTTVAAGSAKSWATLTSSAVSTTFSAKEYAQGTQAATGGSAKNWSQQTGADVTGASANDRSAKSWAQEAITGATLGGSAKDWAQSASKPDGTLESAKTYATNAGNLAAGVTSTSTTSLLIAVASKIFTTQAGKQYTAGMFVTAASAATPTNYMHGQVTSYSGTTLTVDVQDIGGAGTLADWNIAISGTRGAAGATGAAGTIAYTVATGTANAQVLTPTTPLGAYVAGDTRWMVPVATNTSGTVTVAVSGLATRNIKKFIGGAVVILAVGDLIINQPAYLVDDGTQYILANPQTYTQGADVASSGTTNLDTATGDYVNITGTTSITAVTLSQGRQCTVKFAGILTFTNGASLILPTGANITTAAGDTAVLRGEASGVVRCISYNRASGASLVAGGATSINGLSDALYDTATDHNLYLGSKPTIVSGAQFNLSIGEGALSATLTNAADGNIAIGYQALNSNTSGDKNIAIGYQAGKVAVSDTGGVYIGYQAGVLAAGGGTAPTIVGGAAGPAYTSGSGTTLIGNSAGISVAGQNNVTCIGYNTNAAFANSTAVGAGAATIASNSVQLGDASVTSVNAGTSNTAYLKALNTAKAWLQVSVSGGTPTMNLSFNMTSITDTNTGILTCTIATDCATATYCVVPGIALATNNGTVANNCTVVVDNTATAAINAGAFVLYCWNKTATTNVATDPGIWFANVFGTQ